MKDKNFLSDVLGLCVWWKFIFLKFESLFNDGRVNYLNRVGFKVLKILKVFVFFI